MATGIRLLEIALLLDLGDFRVQFPVVLAGADFKALSRRKTTGRDPPATTVVNNSRTVRSWQILADITLPPFLVAAVHLLLPGLIPAQ